MLIPIPKNFVNEGAGLSAGSGAGYPFMNSKGLTPGDI